MRRAAGKKVPLSLTASHAREPSRSYHAYYQLELLPDWIDYALQRLGEVPGPPTETLEVTETELDWFDKGLACAAYYHPIAFGRRQYFRKHRRPPRGELLR